MQTHTIAQQLYAHSEMVAGPQVPVRNSDDSVSYAIIFNIVSSQSRTASSAPMGQRVWLTE